MRVSRVLLDVNVLLAGFNRAADARVERESAQQLLASVVCRGSSTGFGGSQHVCDGTGELAVAYQGDVLLKVGEASKVDEWLDLNRNRFQSMRDILEAMGEDGDDLDVVVVKVPVSQDIVDEINRCVAISGRVTRLRDNLEKIGLGDTTLFERPRYPR